MKKEMLKDYLEDGKLNIDKMLDDFYGYVYIIVKNGVSSYITDEDVEEIISDVFVAIWKNSDNLSVTTDLKAYLAGTAKNRIRNKYRKTEANVSISEYEEKIIEKIRKNIKEEIAISNIRKEFGMKTNKNKKVIYVLSSICAVFILGIGIFIGTNQHLLPSNTIDIGQTDANDGVELNINKIKDMTMTTLDADIKTVEIESLPEKFKFIEYLAVPAEYQLESSYMVNIRSNRGIAEYDVIHDYVFNYRKDSSNDIKIAFSEIEEPIRDYFIDEGDKVSKIGEVELVISQWKEMYIVTFEYKDIYFDIETTGVTRNELVSLLQSVIDGINN